MKKLLFLIIILPLFFCGCADTEMLSGENPEYMISSLGFEKKEDEISVFMEALVINSEDTAAQKKLILLKGKGKDVKTAADEAEKQAVQPISLSHCTTIILNTNLDKDDFEKILDYCYNRDEINLSARFILSENIEKILKEKPIASITVGFDIMSRLESGRRLNGREYNNRFYQIEAQRMKKNPHYDIPILKDGVFTQNNTFLRGAN